MKVSENEYESTSERETETEAITKERTSERDR